MDSQTNLENEMLSTTSQTGCICGILINTQNEKKASAQWAREKKRAMPDEWKMVFDHIKSIVRGEVHSGEISDGDTFPTGLLISSRDFRTTPHINIVLVGLFWDTFVLNVFLKIQLEFSESWGTEMFISKPAWLQQWWAFINSMTVRSGIISYIIIWFSEYGINSINLDIILNQKFTEFYITMYKMCQKHLWNINYLER